MKRILSSALLALSCGILLSACSHLRIDYEFNTGQPFTGIQGAFSDKASTTYRGYMYYFDTKKDKPSLPWDSATLHSPANINGGNDMRQCWNQAEGGGRTLNFYCGGSATSPATPPTGTYHVNVAPKTYTFKGVTSRAIGVDLNNVLVPAVKLTMDSSGKITRIDWQWWKKTGAAWSQPTDSQLASELNTAAFEIGQANWAGDPTTSRVRGSLNVLTTGSVIPPAQAFTPAVLRISYSDKAGYHYGFEWR
jgi:hypothetical protein